MPTFSQLPLLESGACRFDPNGVYKAASFTLKRDAEAWGREAERQIKHAGASGVMPDPKGATLGDLIEAYIETVAKVPGKRKAATLAMLKTDLGGVRLASLSAVTLRPFIDRRQDAGAGGGTIAADLLFLSAALKWARHARHLDIKDRLALEARSSLAHRGLSTRSTERAASPPTTNCGACTPSRVPANGR